MGLPPCLGEGFVPQVLFVYLVPPGQHFRGSRCCGAFLCPTGDGAEMEPPPCLSPAFPGELHPACPSPSPQNLHPWLCKPLQRTGDVTAVPQQLPEIFHKTPAQSFYSSLQGASSSAALRDRGAPRPCRAVQVPPQSRIPSLVPSLAPGSASPSSSSEKGSTSSMRIPAGKPHWRSLIEL